MNAIQQLVTDETKAIAADALKVAEQKLNSLITNHPDLLPLYTKNGKWSHGDPAWTNWCEGFLGGQLWILAERTGETSWREAAESYTRKLRGREFDTEVHDLGFTFWPTWRRWYRLNGQVEAKDIVVQAGRTMGLRFNERAGFLRSFLAEDSTFIDIMMNVGIIQYAAEQDNDDNLRRVVERHCMNTRKYMVRGDGSTSHEGIFDLETGEFLRQTTQQGWRADSSWARGQAWALYGFGTMYAFTKNPAYLETTKLCADFYIRSTGDRLVPPNDWDEPSPDLPFESSAAAIAASGLMQLAAIMDDAGQAEQYAAYALDTVKRLCQPDFLASENAHWEGLLQQGSYHETKSLGVNESVMWGDYFFMESLDKCLGASWVTTDI